MNRVIHFEIHADNPDRAVKFYKDVFGWKVEKWSKGDYWLIETGKEGIGINGGIMKREVPLNGNSIIAYVCTIDVDSVDKMAERIKQNNGKIIAEKMAIPGIGWLAYCKDTESNTFGIMETDMSAK